MQRSFDISTYQFAHNNPVWKIELEGLEGVAFQVLVNADATARPNGIGAHFKGFSQGLINSAKGLLKAVASPAQTAKSLVNTTLAAAAHTSPGGNGQLNAMRIDNALKTNAAGTAKAMNSAISNGAKSLVSGNGEQRGEVLGELAGAVIGAKGMNAAVKGISNLVEANQTTNVFRVYGGDAAAEGFSWTTENPLNVSNFRNAAGLPSGGASGATNTAEFMIEGTVKNKNIINTRSALPLDGNAGGLPELIINPKNVKVKSTTTFETPL